MKDDEFCLHDDAYNKYESTYRTVVQQEIHKSTRLAVPCCLLEGPRLGSLSSSSPSSSTSSSSFRPSSTWPGLRVGTHGRTDWRSALGGGGFVAFDDDIGQGGDHDHDSDVTMIMVIMCKLLLGELLRDWIDDDVEEELSTGNL